MPYLKPKRSYSSMMAFLAFILIIVLLYMITWPMFGEIRELSGKIGERQGALTLGRQRIAQIQSIAAQISSLGTQKDQLDAAMPAEPDAAGALIQINEMVSRVGLKLSSIQPGQSEAGVLPLSIVVEGPFANVLQLIALFEKNLRPVTVAQIDTTPVSEEGGNTLTTTLGLKLPYAESLEEAAKQAQSATGEKPAQPVSSPSAGESATAGKSAETTPAASARAGE